VTMARILIVEDDRIVARDIEQQLLRLGYAVAGMTARGDEALALAVSARADLVLMDVRLQGPVDGVDAAQLIHQQCNIPVVFLTAYADDETVRRASLAEPFGYVLKPFEDSQLRTVIGMALYKHASEQRLRDSERRYAVTLASIGDAVIATDENLVITFMNPAAEVLTGWPAPEAVGMALREVFRVLDGASGRLIDAPMADVLAGGVTVTRAGHMSLRGRGRRDIVIDDCGSPIIDERGKVSGVALVFRDVTARRQAEEAQMLRETQQRIELAVQGSNIGVWELQMPDGHIRNGSVSLINVWEQLGYRSMAPQTATALIGALFQPQDLPAIRAALSAYLARDSARLELETRVRHQNGSVRWMLIRGVAVRNARQRATSLVGTCVDVTDLTGARLALRDGELRWRSMTEALPHLIWTVTADGIPDFFSPQCCAYFGLTEAEMTGFDVWLRNLHPEDRERCSGVWHAAFAAVARYDVEMRLRRHDGAFRWFHSVAIPVRDARGRVTRWFGTSTDISERKQAEAAMLEAKVAAESANSAKNRFLANISHELRTPLNGILGYAQILRGDGALNDRQLEGVNVIAQSGEYLLALINDILDFSRIEARKLELEVADVWLEKFVRVIVDIMGMRAREKGIELVCDLLPSLPYAIRVDERRLRQVLLNLLANAIRFTDDGEVTLCVEFTAPDRLRFEIRDTGIGIAPEALEAIFRPFEQAGELQRRTAGVGLGLAISRQLVRLMGSDILVRSEVDVGSTFWFELRLDQLQGDPVLLQPEPVAQGYAGARKRVLVADDVKANRSVAVRMLGALGFETVEVEDGEAAIASVALQGIDLILMDAVMPKLDGIDAIGLLKSDPRHRSIPIIAISANVSGQNKDKCLAAGADVFLSKPINLAALLEQIRRLLDLAWIYHAPEQPDPGGKRAAPTVYPPADEIDTLHRLALQGNMRAIVERAGYLLALDPHYAHFASQLCDLARNFQSKAMLRLIEQVMEGASQGE
jgi:PAS domain S-box-containing protein